MPVEGLFADPGIPAHKKLFEKFNSLKAAVQNTASGGRIAILPERGTVVFIGDLHGDFEAVVSIVRQVDFFGAMKRRDNMYLVFLGDYGDRGAKIIETINEVITLKLEYPAHVILLRGNHEETEMMKYYGTEDAFLKAYGGGLPIFDLYCRVMRLLPVVAITGNGIIGVHGGIPNRDITSIFDLNGDFGESLAREMTWNDPDAFLPERGANTRGGSTMTFGQGAFDRFMEVAPAKVMVRSHQYPPNGVQLFFNNRLATIFSNGSERSVSSAYKRYVKRPVFLKVDLSVKKERFEESDFMEVLY